MVADGRTAVTLGSLVPLFPADGLNDALGAIRVLGLELIEEELKPHLNTVLSSVKDKSQCCALHLLC